MLVDVNEVCDAVQWQQFQRFRRGVSWTPRRFSLTSLSWEPGELIFSMRGDTADYELKLSYFRSAVARECDISCSCPDSYPGLCKHLCWLVFKVLRHAGLEVFRTRQLPRPLYEGLIHSARARLQLLVQWGHPDPVFGGIPDRELSFDAWDPPRNCPFAPPTTWSQDDTDCSICYEVMDREAAKQCPDCSNCFHDACIARWFSLKNTCPLCRQHFVNV